MNNISSFESNPGFFFYVGVAFYLSILTFTSQNLIMQDLSICSFLFLNALAFIILYGFAFRFSGRIYVDEKMVRFNYYFKDRKQLIIPTHEIINFEKQPDTVHRYYKKLLITTPVTTFLIKYNISDNSDLALLKLLDSIVRENKIQLEKDPIDR